MRTASRVMTWVCVLVIAVLSLLPADAMVRTGFDGRVEHFVAYAGTMLIAGVGYGMQRGSLLKMAALCIYAGALEILQNFSPGRHPSFLDFAASCSGVVAGGLLFMLTLGLLPKFGGVRSVD
jgi:VanZ family protein